VVLPFENLGPAEERYFADGVTKEITARLSEVAGLGVIDPSSALSYRGEGKPLARVAEELRAQYVLQGSVRWQRGPEGMGRVRVTPQLIRAGDERQLWAHVYEREMKDLFDVQSDIARSVVAALNLALGPSGLMGLDSHPTTDMEAYDHYLRGMAFFTGSTSEEDSRLALQMFEKAVALDPRFALAWAVSARAHMRMYNSYFDRSEARLHLADEASRRALAIAPDLPEALIARGLYYYWGFKDYARGIEQFDKVLAKRPDHPGALELKAYVFRRQGRFEEALALLERVFPLNPRAGILAKEMGTTAMLLRRYSEAHRFYDEALTLAPDMAETYCLKAQLTLSETGERAKALAVLESALEMGIQDGDVIAYSAILMAMDGRTGEALERLDRSAVKAFSAMDNYEPRELVRGRILELAGRKAEARAEYGKAARVLRDLIRSDPGDARFQSALGLALAGLGSWPEAFAAGRRGVELMPVAKDALEAPPRVLDLARLHALKGQPREAWKLLEPLLASPTLVSAGYLRSDPVWRDVVEIGAPAPEDES
jgi:TolB-like protein/tetratricopeptide (TPR) repeat protein